jgi:phospholipid/cholesterol/gamma-HCH transport system substrate-binding protein
MARKLKLGIIVAAGLAIVGVWAIPRTRGKVLNLAACFEDVQGLRVGAAVRIAGVEVGRVTQVRARPDRKDCPAEVAMRLSTPYDLQVPNDAIAEVSTEGLLGPAYIDINVQHATGPPATDHATLKTGPTVSPLDAVRALADDIRKKVTEEKTAPPKPPTKQK